MESKVKSYTRYSRLPDQWKREIWDFQFSPQGTKWYALYIADSLSGLYEALVKAHTIKNRYQPNQIRIHSIPLDNRFTAVFIVEV